MRKLATYAFVAALLAGGFAIPASAVADCGAAHSTKSVDMSTPDNNGVADSSASQSSKPASGN